LAFYVKVALEALLMCGLLVESTYLAAEPGAITSAETPACAAFFNHK